MKHSGTKADFMTGFVIIQSDTELDVVAVYTAAGTDGQVETIHTERVPARRSQVQLPDLVPVPDEKGFFCKRKEGNLIVTVKNQGASDAGPSVTEVDFYSHGKIAMPTPPLTPNASINILNGPI